MNMRFFITALLSVIILFPLSSRSQWVRLDRPAADFRCLEFSGSTLYGVGSRARVYQADSTGTTWIQVYSLFWIQAPDFLCYRIAVFPSVTLYGGDRGRIFWNGRPSNSGVESDILDFAEIRLSERDLLFAAGWGCGVLESQDSGATWSSTNSGLSNLNLNCMASGESILGIDGQLLFAGTYGDGLFWSTDNGATWNWRGAGLGNQFIDEILVTDTTIYVGLSGGEVYGSNNWGEDWQKVGQGSPGTELLSLGLLWVGGERWLFAGTVDAGIWRALLPDGTWEPVNTNLENLRINSIAARDSLLFVGTQQGVYRSADFGTSWTLVSDMAFPPMLNLMAAERETGSEDSKLFVATGYDNAPPMWRPYMGVCTTTDDGADWVGTPIYATFVPSMAHYGDLIFVVDGGDVDNGGAEVFASTDWGQNWMRSSPDDPRLKVAGRVLVHYRQGKGAAEVFLTTSFALGCICVSSDSGRTWSIMYDTYPRATGLLAAQDSLLFYTGSQRLYRLNIDTEGLVEITANLPYTVISSLASTQELLYTGFAVNTTYNSSGGLYCSNDYGESWSYSGFDGKTINQIVPHKAGLFVLAENRAYYSPGSIYGWTEIGANLGAQSLRELSLTSRSCYALGSDSYSLWRRDINEIIESSVSLPVAPVLLDPPSASVNVPTTVSLKWSRPQSTEGFRLQVSSSPSFAVPDVVDDTSVVDTVYHVPGLLNGITYYWRVCGRNLRGYGPWSESRSFTTIVQVSQGVTLVSPAPGALISADTVLLYWRHAIPSIDRYWVETATDSLFQYRAADSTVTDTTYTVRGLQSGLDYWWRVKAHNVAGWSPFSEVRRFAVSVTGLYGLIEIPTEYSLAQNYPNPFNPSTVIRFGLPKKSHVSLVIFNAVGQRLAELVNEEKEAGYHEVSYNASGLASGFYMYRLKSGEFVQTRKLLLVR